MIGSIIGDVCGSSHEWAPVENEFFNLFDEKSTITDDSILTIAVAKVILTDGDFAKTYREVGRRFPNAGYGGKFNSWLFSDTMGPYNSFGNGSAMRVSPIGFAYDDIDTVLQEAKRSAEVTHDHPEGIKGAQATALAIVLARKGSTKKIIRDTIEDSFGYDLSRDYNEICQHYSFDVTCQGSVPESIIAFLVSESYEDAIRKAVALGGDSDTQACIAGGIAQAFYKHIPQDIIKSGLASVPEDLMAVIDEFNKEFNVQF